MDLMTRYIKAKQDSFCFALVSCIYDRGLRNGTIVTSLELRMGTLKETFFNFINYFLISLTMII